MPGHTHVEHYTQGAAQVALTAITEPGATTTMNCPHCGHAVMGAVIARTREAPTVTWIRCASCGMGIVDHEGQLAPSPKVGENLDGLTTEVASAYDEARRTAGAAAYTSCELMCRKILMHVAVDKGAPEGETFVAYLDYLRTSGYITPPMLPWVDLIRTHGNASTHRLQAASPERALNTLAFTAQLLRLVYEMDHRAQQYVTPTPP